MNTLHGLLIDHVAIATPNLDTASAPYLALGLQPETEDEIVESQGVKVRAFCAQHSLIELLMPTRADSPIQVFLDKKGAGLHHIALRVDDLSAKIAELKLQGAQFIFDTPRAGRAGTQVVFLHPKWGAGTLIELVEHPNSTHF